MENASPAVVVMLDPRKIRPSKWANRQIDSYKLPQFFELQEEIQRANTNVQPIKVRPVSDGEFEYEIVFGHRRHQACLVLERPVAAIIEPLTDRQTLIQMALENNGRTDLRPYEKGVWFLRAMATGLVGKTADETARTLGEKASNFSNAVKLAGLPDFVLDAFASRLDLQHRWAKPLHDAVKKDAAAVMAAAERIAGLRASPLGASLTAKDVFEHLTSTGRVKAEAAAVREIIFNERPVCQVKKQGDAYSFAFEKGSVSESLVKDLELKILELLELESTSVDLDRVLGVIDEKHNIKNVGTEISSNHDPETKVSDAIDPAEAADAIEAALSEQLSSEQVGVAFA